MTPLTLDLLGGFRASLGPRTLAFSKKAQALLAYLALSPGRRHSRARLADLLWGDRPEDLARNSVRHALFEIRKPFGSGWARFLTIDHEWVELLAAEVTVDALEIQRLAAEGTLVALEQAARLCRGELLEGHSLNEATLESWLIGERERVHELGLRVLAALLDAQVEAEAADSAIETGIRLLALDPLRESVHRILMRLYAAQGRPAAARRQYQLCADALMRELRVEPEAETKQLYHEVSAPRAPAGAASRTEVIPVRRRAADQVQPAADSTRALPLIGRSTELARLRQALGAARSGQAHVVSILGEAGVGKTRLVQELAAASQAGVCLIEASAHESEQILPFSLWVEALRRSGVIADPEALGELPTVWQQEIARLFPQLRIRGTPPRSGMDDHLRIFEAIAQLVDATARRRPVLILLEDLHWADPTSLRLVPFLARRLAGARMCVVLTTRVEETDSPSVLRGILAELARDTRHLELRIPPLGRAETLGLLRALLGGAAPVAALEERIWRLSEGNPFVVVEAMRTLQERGRAGAPDDVPIPDGVRRIVAERLERLGSFARELSALAAVMDGPFEAVVLQEAAGHEPHDIALAVEELVRQHILQETAASLAFTHDRIRAAIYDGLVEPRRRLLHVATAEAIERLHAVDLDAHRAALAGHWRAAQVWDRAALHLRAIATQAVARGAYREALALLEETLRALDRLPADVAMKTQAIDVHVEVRDLLVTLGEISASLDHTDAAGRLAREVGDEPRLAIALSKAGHSRYLMGDQARAIELSQEILAIGKRLGDERIESLADFRLGQSYHALGDYRRAVEHLERSAVEATIHHAPAIGLPSIISRTWLALSLAELGRFDQAIVHAERALADAEAVSHIYSRLFALLMLGRVQLFHGDPGRAVPPLEQSYALAEAWHVGLMRRDCAVALAEGYARVGRSAEARSLLERRFTDDDGFGSRGLAHRIEAMLALGWADDALRGAREALEGSRALGERAYEARSLRALGEALAQGGPEGRGRAAAQYRQALSLAEELGMRPLVARCHLGLGLLDAARTSPAQLERAATLFDELGMPAWLAQARAALARVPGRKAAVRGHKSN